MTPDEEQEVAADEAGESEASRWHRSATAADADMVIT